MKEQEKTLLKKKIEKATVVSFDIFDTLLFRKTNTPETVFDLVGKHFGIHGFRKLRVDAQNEASRRAYAEHKAPHANMDEIYAVLGEYTEIPVDWDEVKAYEIELESDALTANGEMLEMFRYARQQGKRVVATSDMYLFAATLSGFLEKEGFCGFDRIYCSADEQKAKFNKELFRQVIKEEGVPGRKILHIGDKARDDGEYPAGFGIQTFVYEREGELEKVGKAAGSDVDAGLYKILYDGEKGFWYNLGVEVGGPIYMGLYQFVRKKLVDSGKKMYFLSRDGYNLYHIFKENGYENVEYLYTSRRALTLAAIREMDEQAVESLPPYACGQTVGEILDYLGVDRKEIRHLAETGLQSFEQVVRNSVDVAAFKKLYEYDRAVFLRRCEQERENAVRYFQKIGFFDEDVLCFDCGWQGSSQLLMERFQKAVGCTAKHEFVYFGIRNGEKSRSQLRGLHYDTYLFDFYKNYSLQNEFAENVVMYELFFSAPHESVYCYDGSGEPVLEAGAGDREKEELLSGIRAYLREGLPFVEKYDVEYTPELAVGHLMRLIHAPTEEEAVRIGNLENVDGFARQRGEKQYIARFTREDLEKNRKVQVYWPNGLLARPDVPEEVKKEYALGLGRRYPAVHPDYHLEDIHSLDQYRRWLEYQKTVQRPEKELSHHPFFSVVIPVYNTVTEQLEECIQSVLAQTYPHYELILVDDCSTWNNVVPVLRKYEGRSNVRVIYRSSNGHISAATNDGIGVAAGEFIVFMDCDDTIEPTALYEFAAKLNENPELDFIYSDEDKLTEDGKLRHMAFFKPDWSPDLFLNMMYTNHLATYRASIVKEVGGLRSAYNGSQDYDFTLRFMERSDHKRVGHVAKILYHWRERKESVAYAITSKNYASEAARHAKEDYIRRNGIKARLEYITGMSQYRIVYDVVGAPLVSIIIPSKDHPEILKQCIDSLREFTRYPHYELIVVDNGSSEQNRARVAEYLSGVGAKYVYEAEEFNFSRMCNRGASCAQGEYLLFLNDDVEFFQPDWLERMLGQAQQKHVGAVGAKLFYPGTTRLQHAGVSNPEDGPQHTFITCDDQFQCYFGWNRMDYDCIAVTGACLLLSAEKFRAAGGFDESYPVAYNDVKLCFVLHRMGYYNVIRNDAAAYHHESLSRGSDDADQEKQRRLLRERTKLFAEFGDIREKDPYLNEHLHYLSVSLELKGCQNSLVEIPLRACRPGAQGHIDTLITDQSVIQVAGWFAARKETDIAELERYVIFKDPYEKIVGVRVLPQPRADVAKHFNQPGWLHCGFVCQTEQFSLRVDLFPYDVGVLSIDKAGKQYINWLGKTEVTRKVSAPPGGPKVKKLSALGEQGQGGTVRWHLDLCARQGMEYRMEGYAFRPGREHYLYQTSLVFRDGDGNAYRVDTQRAERPDVACEFPQEHFLNQTGFVCDLPEGMLPGGREYDVIIRLTHQFRQTDIVDVPTGEKISL